MAPPTSTVQDYIASLAGRYEELQDSRVVSGEASRRFNNYIYSRKLLIRKSVDDDSGYHVIYCTHCHRAPWRVRSNFTTSSTQLRHLRKHHPRLPTTQAEEDAKLRELDSASASTKVTATPFALAAAQAPSRSGFSQFDNKIFREHLAAFVVSSNSPLAIVENSNFHRMLLYCNPKVRSISRRTLGRDIQALYSTLLQQILKRLQDHCDEGGKVSFTLDAWSSPTRIPFLGLTAHYIEGRNWDFRSILLGFERLRGSHTADSLSRVSLSVLQRFQLVKSVRAITTDNASTNTKMLNILERSLPGFTAKDNHIRCMAHIINLAVQDILSHLRITPTEEDNSETSEDNNSPAQRIPKAFWRARRIIGKIRASNLLWESFEAQSSAAKLPMLKLILDMPVRWNSTHDMLNRLLQLRPAVHAVCKLEEGLRLYALSDDDWNLLSRLRSILDIFVKATEHLSGSSYPTLSVQLPYFVVLASRLEQLVEELRETDPNSDLLAALTQAWVKLDKYHAQTASSQAIATILDPRYKLQTFRNLSWREEWIIEARTSFVQTYNDQYAPSLADSDRPPTPDPFENDGLEDDFLLAVFGSQSSTFSSNAPSELEVYLEEPVEGRKVDPIEWWRTYASKFPHLSLMARDFLAIPATSVPSERMFSIAGQILTKRRSSLSENMMNALMCTRNWLGFPEVTPEELTAEEDLLDQLQELSTDGDVLVFPMEGDEDD